MKTKKELFQWCGNCKDTLPIAHTCGYTPVDIPSKLRELAKKQLDSECPYISTPREIDRRIESVLEKLFKLANI